MRACGRRTPPNLYFVYCIMEAYSNVHLVPLLLLLLVLLLPLFGAYPFYCCCCWSFCFSSLGHTVESMSFGGWCSVGSVGAPRSICSGKNVCHQQVIVLWFVSWSSP
ncbi:unnamed protein product, partial [Ectocarpus sp. 8 AP-2014]